MRVIGGELKGQRLMAPRGTAVRPTSERAREAIFSVLGERVVGARVLDLCCGTGALAIEALSRGAVHATLVDRDVRGAIGNVERLGLGERTELVRAHVSRWLGAREDGGARYDIIFLDAPYKLADRVGRQFDSHLPTLLAPEGRAIVESSARHPLQVESLPRLRQRRYGAADVAIYGEQG